MATLQIRKKSAKVWAHIASNVTGPQIISKFYCKTSGNNFRIVEQGGSQRPEYSYSDISVYDDTDTGTEEVFASAQALMQRLEALDYPGFQSDGDAVTTYIEDGTNTTVTGSGTAGDPYQINATGGGGGSQDIDSVLGDGDTATGKNITLVGDETVENPTYKAQTADESEVAFMLPQGVTVNNVDGFETQVLKDKVRLSKDAVGVDIKSAVQTSDVTLTIPDLAGFDRNATVSVNGNYADVNGNITVAAGGANLSYTASPTNGIVASDSGTDATLTLVDGTNAGLMSPAQHTKLAGVATGATANDTDANLKNRANHTGTQTASTISDFNSAAKSAAVADTITNGVTDVAPSQNAVFDALALLNKVVAKSSAVVTPVTGSSAEQTIYSATIAAGEFAAGNLMEIKWRSLKSGTAGTVVHRIRISNTNTLASATQIATLTSDARSQAI